MTVVATFYIHLATPVKFPEQLGSHFTRCGVLNGKVYKRMQDRLLARKDLVCFLHTKRIVLVFMAK